MVAEYECEHRLRLNFAAKSGFVVKPQVDDKGLEIIANLGVEHELRILAYFESKYSVKKLDQPEYSVSGFENGMRETIQAMNDGIDVIYQATVFTGDFVGFIDFLVKAKDQDGNPITDYDGRTIYEPFDTKSARSAKKSAVIQIAAYCEALVRLGLPQPLEGHLWLGNDEIWHGDARKLIPLSKELRERTFDVLNASPEMPSPSWGAPISSCATCVWKKDCETGRKLDRDLSMIQGIYGVTRHKLIAAGITTIDAMAALTNDQCPVGISRATFENLREQAACQVEAEKIGEIISTLRDGHVLTHYPPASKGDMWFDMEGDPYAFGGRGLEYMFGFGFLKPSGEFDFDTTEGHDAASEKKAFEDFIDLVMERIEKFPDMHIYHYANYERKALVALSHKYATREDEVIQILREGRLVDLYTVVRYSFRISTPSLSIKDVEHIYRGNRDKDGVSTAMDSVIQYEAYVASKASGDEVTATAILDKIRDYNKDDCESTWQLDNWVREQISKYDISYVPLTENDIDEQRSPNQQLAEALLKDVPVDAAERNDKQQAIANIAACVVFHNREMKPYWWNLFELAKATPEELDAASDALAFEKVKAEGWGMSGRQTKPRRLVKVECAPGALLDLFETDGPVHLFYSAGQPGMMNLGDMPGGFSSGKIVEIKQGKFAIIEEYGTPANDRWDVLPIGMTPGTAVNHASLETQLGALGMSVLGALQGDDDPFPPNAWTDILLRRKPRQIELANLRHDNQPFEDIKAALEDSHDSYIAVQGPPGTGKTFTGSKVVADLVAVGWKVGVVAQSHAVVEQFMDKVREKDPNLQLAKAPKGPKTLPYHNSDVPKWAEGRAGGYLIGGTAWTFVGPKIQALELDLIVIDEAGQFSLANTIAVASTSKKILMLGDPQQLPQVSQGSHPEPVEVAALAHLLDGEPTISDDMGYFLDTSYRMHSEVTRKVSDLQYEGKLHSHESTDLRHLAGITPGVHSVVVDHGANRTSSPEEAAAVLDLCSDLLGRSWTSEPHANSVPLDQGDIIIVAAYNAQVRLLRRTLRDAGLGEIQVGTVDKFQGREAAVAIVSMATSSDEDLPRGLDFLLSPNRLNVAISRAQWAAYVVSSPQLRKVSPSGIPGMLCLGGFLGVID